MTQQLTISHLAPYLAYGIEIECLDYKTDYVGKQFDTAVGVHQWDRGGKYWSVLTVGGSKPEISRVKPILRPLSQLTQEIEHNGEKFVPAIILGRFYSAEIGHVLDKAQIILERDIKARRLAYDLFTKLFEWHFDVFGIIDAGLAIEKGAEA